MTKCCKCQTEFEGPGFIDGLDAVNLREIRRHFNPEDPIPKSVLIKQATCESCARCGEDVMSVTWAIGYMARLIKENAEKRKAERAAKAAELEAKRQGYRQKHVAERGAKRKAHQNRKASRRAERQTQGKPQESKTKNYGDRKN